MVFGVGVSEIIGGRISRGLEPLGEGCGGGGISGLRPTEMSVEELEAELTLHGTEADAAM